MLLNIFYGKVWMGKLFAIENDCYQVKNLSVEKKNGIDPILFLIYSGKTKFSFINVVDSDNVVKFYYSRKITVPKER